MVRIGLAMQAALGVARRGLARSDMARQGIFFERNWHMKQRKGYRGYHLGGYGRIHQDDLWSTRDWHDTVTEVFSVATILAVFILFLVQVFK